MYYAVPRRLFRTCVAAVSLASLTACSGLDFDMRGRVGDNFNTADAALNNAAQRPEPDDRGVITYQTYQVAVARRGDTLADVANRLGLNPAEIARYNGVRPDDTLRAGELVALPGPITNSSDISVTELAGNAIDSASPTPSGTNNGTTGSTKPMVEPIRHKVERGETVYTIARLYNVSVRSLADLNSLDRSYTLREGQVLLVPVTLAKVEEKPISALKPPAVVTAPGAGSPTPTPPSASRPLPANTPPAASEPATATVAPSVTVTKSPAVTRDSQMAFPVKGSIVREYSKGRSDGIDISASAGSDVEAAATGVVAAVTSDADNVPIVIVRHPDNLLTVYANIGDIKVKKDDRVTRGQELGKVRPGSPPYIHFEVRKGFDSVDPMPYLQ